MEKKYYWLKLKRDFFKRHDIRVIEAMPNGKDYILFYLKLLCESVDHDGKLRFNETVPYNADMLSVITDTNKDTVRAAIDLFVDLSLMEIMDDGTLYMLECEKMVGATSVDNSTERVRRFRERQKEAQKLLVESDETECNVTETEKRNESKSKSKSKSNNNIVEKSTPDSVLKAEFEEVWKEYPKKEGKTNAEKDYLKARKEGVSKETILDGVRRYREKVKGEETRYILNGSTYFHQRRWEDEYTKDTKENFERNYKEDIYESIYGED